ncbi:MAG: hypothetical protein HKN43_13185 [Rhodothermales bacterium]|nr:hypothetical protein [Rhodothermales bacterium]
MKLRLFVLPLAALFYMGCEHVSANEDGAGCVTAYDASAYPTSTVSYQNDVKPILANNSCSSEFCHGSGSPPSNFSVLTAEAMLGPGNEAVQLETCDIVRGDPDGSYLVKKLEGAAGIIGEQMPFGGTPLTSGELNTIRQWITEGAPDN